MKTRNNFPQNWQIIILVAVILFLTIQSCSTAKQVHQETTKVESQVKTTETDTKSVTGETNTLTKINAVTDITESCDTTLSVWPIIDGVKADQPVPVTIKFDRTTHRTEFTDQKQEKKETGISSVVKKDQITQKSEMTKKDKIVERTGFPWWGWVILILVVLTGVAVTLWRMKIIRL